MQNLDSPSGMTSDRSSPVEQYRQMVNLVREHGRMPAMPQLQATLQRTGKTMDDFRRDCGQALTTAASNRLG
jgi:hypothetical protein